MNARDPHGRRRRGSLPAAAALLAAALGLGASAAWADEAGWTAGDGHRWRPLGVPAGASPRLRLLDAAETGILFTNRLAEQSGANNRVFENGSGVALGDVDGDGRCDVYLCRLEGDNVLYRNLGGGRFEDITAAAGVGCPGQYSTGAVLADVDGDGAPDLLVNAIGGGTRLFLNNGRGGFQEHREGRLVRRFGATSMALADMDSDGDLDLYVTNYRTDTFRDDPPGLRVEGVRLPDGTITVKPEGRFVPLTPRDGGLEVIERGERDFLYLNQGGGRFAPVAWNSGAFLDEDGQPVKEAPTDWGLSVMFRDFTGDGLPDLYVCNDFAYWPDRIWINDGGVRFRAAPRTAFRSQSLSSMAVDVADINRDGWPDLFVADMLTRRLEWRAWQRPNTLAGLVRWPREDPGFRPEVTRNTLHLARGDGTFAEIACLAGLAATEWTWGAVFVDLDLDGWEDLLIANGNAHDVQHADVLAELAGLREARSAANRLKNVRKFPPLHTPNLAFRNQRDLTFSDRSAEWGFHEAGVTTGMALGDLDGDGDLEVVLSDLNGPARVYRNDSPEPRLAVRLRGRAPNTAGIGARIRVTGGPVEQTQEMIAGGRYLGGDDTLRVFAAGTARELEVEVRWRSGAVSRVAGVAPNRLLEVLEPGPAGGTAPAIDRTDPGWFAGAPLPGSPSRTGPPAEPPPLLPVAIPSPTPALAAFRGPAGDSLLLADATGLVHRIHGDGGATPFTSVALGATEAVAPRPVAGAILPARADASGIEAWAGAASNGVPRVVRTGATGSHPPVAVPDLTVLAAGDVDGDGGLELLTLDPAGPGVWPSGGTLRLFRREGAGWTESGRWDDVGAIHSAVFTDLDGDGDQDLVVAGHWQSLRWWRNDGGRLGEVAATPGLSEATGWWNSVTAADFDGDGRMDLLAGNWGLNFRTDPSSGRPGDPGLRLRVGAIPGGGGTVALAGLWDPEARRWAPARERAAILPVLPLAEVNYPTHAQFGQARLEDLLPGEPPAVRDHAARWFASTVFLNRGDRFEAGPLPPAAQLSPVFGLAVADLDGDGHLDAYLAQNWFATDAETSRQDGGMGVVLFGRGDGTFGTELPGANLAGEGRAAVVADFDADGRPDVAVAQATGPALVLRNHRGGPGHSVLLAEGPDGTLPAGIQIRRIAAGAPKGPRHEWHLGAGWASADSPTVFLGSAPPEAIEVRRPGRAPRTLPWPSGTRRVRLLPDDRLEPVATAP